MSPITRYQHGQPLDFTPTILPRELFSERPICTLGYKRLVLCIAGGEESNRYAEITTPRMKEYAIRCGALFVLKTDDLAPDYKVWNKYRVTTLAANFEQTLLLDTDVIVSRAAPDIFDLCRDDFGVVDARPDMNMSLLAEAEAIFDHTGLILPPRLLNGGVIHFPRHGLKHYRPTYVVRHWCYDQWYLSYYLHYHRLPTVWLSDAWNTLPTSPRYRTPYLSYMMHAAGVHDRVEHLKYLDTLVP